MVWALLAVSALALAQNTAPDPTGPGPYATTSAEYKFPAGVDPDIGAGQATELWARVYRPNPLPDGQYPLVVFLHGNHATCGFGMNPRVDNNCQYTTLGTCPGTHVVTPNHNGYGYIADQLASWGYIVVSINVNRGINCRNDGPVADRALNLARGRMVLKHIQRLSEWNTTGGTPASLGVDLQGKIDFGNVGLVGHSRGGEGVRAAYNLYRDVGSPWPDRIPDPLYIGAIFEIGPVDGQSSRTLNADGAVWNVLLPMCDGDVSDLQGVKPFDRMMNIRNEDPATQKSTFTVWGTNHNFYNTEWQLSDSGGCRGHSPIFAGPPGSPRQQQVGMAAVMALIRGNVGAQLDPTFNQNFNPLYLLPDVVSSVTRVDRGFTDSPSNTITTVLNDLSSSAGLSSSGITVSFGPVPNHSPSQNVARVSWTSAGGYLQANFAAQDISGLATLDFRVSRQSSSLNPAGSTSFSIQLVAGDGTLSDPAPLNAYTDLVGPVGGPPTTLHAILQTARIPLGDFNIDLSSIAGVRFTFDDTASGAIYMANARLSSLYDLTESGLSQTAVDLSSGYNPSENWSGLSTINAMNIINSIKIVPSSEALDSNTGVEIELLSTEAFSVRDELTVLRIGDKEFTLSRYADDGNTNTLVFTLTPEEFAQIGNGDPVTVQYGRGTSPDVWNFGTLDKSLASR
jgi:hypothetical protein